MDLISAMLMVDQNHRPAVSEILSHPWLQLETATHEGVLTEFQSRKAKMSQVSETDIPEMTKPNVFKNTGADRGPDNEM